MSTINHLIGYAFAKKKGDHIDVFEGPHTLADFFSVIAEGSDVPRILKDRFADVVNVRDFGAKGDGVTDDTAAIIAASRTGRVFFPKGTYKMVPSASSTVAALSSLNGLSGLGTVKVTIPVGVLTIPDRLRLSCTDGVSVEIAGSGVVDASLTNASVTISGTKGQYVASVDLPDTSSVEIGCVVSFAENSCSTEKVDSLLNGAYRVSAISGSTISFPLNYHAGAHEAEQLSFTGVVKVYRTTLHSTSGEGLFMCESNGNLLLKDLGLVGSHPVGDLQFDSSVGMSVPAGRLTLENCGITEFGVGISVENANADLCYVRVGNSNFGLTASQFSTVTFDVLACCECKRDGVSIDVSSAVFGKSEGRFIGNTKRGVWCHGGSGFFSNAKQFSCFNGQAGFYCKSFASIYVGKNSCANYNYTTGAADCPGFGCEDNSFVMASGTVAKGNGIGYSPGGGSSVDAIDASAVDNVDTNYYALVGSMVEAMGSTSTGAKYGYSAAEGSAIRCKNAEVSGATNTAVIANRGSAIRCDSIKAHDNETAFKSGYNCDIYAPNAERSNNKTDFTPDRGGTAYIGKETMPTYFVPGKGDIFPYGDNSQRCGLAGRRWSNIFAATGSVQTSDERTKTGIVDPEEALMRAWGKVNFKVFQFKDAVEKKGADARLHVGVIAQQVVKAFESEGLDAYRYGLLCYDKWESVPAKVDEDGRVRVPAIEAGELFGIRYEEALALEAAYQRWKLQKIEATLVTMGVKL